MKFSSERFVDYYPLNGWKATAKAFKLSKFQVNSLAQKLGVKVNAAVTNKLKGINNIGKTTSTPAIDKQLIKYYLTIPEKTLATKIGKSHCFIKTRLRQLGLVVPREIVEQRKIDSRIKKGNVPVNKGKKMSAEQYAKALPTMFKKGQVAHNKKDLGHERVNVEGYVEVRVNYKNNHNYWILKHRLIYELHYGVKLKTEDYIIFKDKNKRNFSIDNLIMVSRRENLERNTIHRLPPDLKNTIRTLGTLKRKINHYGKKQNYRLA